MLKDILAGSIDEVVNEFIQRYRLSFNELPDGVYEEFEVTLYSILNATLNGDEDALKQGCKDLASLNFNHNIPYVLLLNELNTLKTTLTNIMLLKNAKDEVFHLHLIYSDVENVVAFEHLGSYMHRLLHINNIRINSLKDLMRKNLITHYQSHLEWLSQLTQAIQNRDIKLIPELNSKHCNFGKWLSNEGKLVISNNSKYELIVSIHNNLHGLAKAIEQQMQKKIINYNILMSYLEKCEFISLSIGTELALIDNRLLINESSKDKMTGALNRNSLEQIFVNQYELALATSTSFVFAMCDLDYFKQLNDTHGHLTGDKVLKEFVCIARNLLRDSDIIVRYGGEEFIIILPNSDIQNGEKKLNLIRESFKNLCCSQNDQHLDVGVSIGAILVCPKENISKSEIDVDVFIGKADKKLYKAKSEGRNRVIFH